MIYLFNVLTQVAFTYNNCAIAKGTKEEARLGGDGGIERPLNTQTHTFYINICRFEELQTHICTMYYVQTYTIDVVYITNNHF